ncbi:MAG TPA: adenine deaminase C-terminal domain-containing protein, partial [Sporosarcina sp.]|nr:adenine deaminase C-terminal domain-containing protein [Sporosarcina sp.]
ALDAGIDPIDAYAMATYNPAKHYDMTDRHGLIATGRLANLNFLSSPTNPVPTDVLSKGVWILRDGQSTGAIHEIDWSIIPQFDLSFELTKEDLQFDSKLGIEMINDVITKPYEITSTVPTGDESYLVLLDRNGQWKVNTFIKGFATNVQGFASSYSNTGDLILIGKSKEDIIAAFNEMKRIAGGIILTEKGETVSTLPLPIGGGLSSEPVEQLIEQELALKEKLAERGFAHGDAIYTLLFLQSTHLPYIRITQKGLLDVMKREILVPAETR